VSRGWPVVAKKILYEAIGRKQLSDVSSSDWQFGWQGDIGIESH
jgi:hypothetical protein